MSRLIRGWKFQYSVIRSIADWTVILYIVIPGAVIGAFIYHSWWQTEPKWIENIPFSVILLIVYVLSWNGNFRTFVQDADRVFLIKNKSMYIGLKRRGFFYSISYQFISILLIYILLLPFLVKQYSFTLEKSLLFLIWFFSIKLLILYLKIKLRQISRKLRRIGIGILLFITISWFTQFMFYMNTKGCSWIILLFGICFLSTAIYLSTSMLRKNYLDIELETEQNEKLKYVHLILHFSTDVEKTIHTTRTKPFLFRKSTNLFKNRSPRNGLIELFIKIFIRNSSYYAIYIQMVMVTSGALIFIPPIWIKAIIFVSFLIMMNVWLSLLWGKVIDSHPLSKRYKEELFFIEARKRTIFILFCLSLIIIGLALSFSIFLKAIAPSLS
ncbi:ABC transporter permease [Bacillus sp. 03113]|uniref:ABC transporter permease n=1 Tax=Bacillus sp. 03113 TaxID=2578211 RepID=UPI0015E8C180|nr:ABC transporter permease [Bacillus sp. 03113]